jgi:NADPH:quinone reductase-like Zn-dependent oxidoreductase
MDEAGSIGVTYVTAWLCINAAQLILGTLTPGFEAGALRLPVAGINRYSVQDAIAAYEQVLNRSATGKVMLAPKSI